ncbi:M14 family metallopeptidase [Winogradskyella vincentii]|uniref:M14 family metallopeptidase n=1 Tax=Winogradskyella vincentii TaxID=2877122 RepID=A0ABS7XZ87_9FLAO|nr:M14 metallopeptidase family protein [Winogradskyella vincentii]MCA0152979.1 M14 family metallopeptidase [Winogradskyella vincentii]
MNIKRILRDYSNIKEPLLFGRYITNKDIEKCFKKLRKIKVEVIGNSVENRPIYGMKVGHGSIKILMWSQMHGNESTTTKALFDCLNLFESKNELSKNILENCTLYIIPILNPDGSQYYTRLNANKVDLNRDAQDLSQPESKVLRSVFNDFRPNYCLNLHGQRTIYGVGDTGKSASMSFLSPSQDEKRSITVNREKAMSIISSINEALQDLIPESIARYDDGFNLNCVGDTFQSLGIPTVLYEAGHINNDYNREEIRESVFISLLMGLSVIANGINTSNAKDYFKIPENTKSFYDIIIRNAKIIPEDEMIVDIAIQYEEVLNNEKLIFKPKIEVISNLDKYFGHKEYDAEGEIIKSVDKIPLEVAREIDFVLINNDKIALKP